MAKYSLLGGIIMSGFMLAGCGTTAPSAQNSLPTEPTVTERVNQFLTNQGITLPPGVARADLKDAAGGSNTGVVTKDIKNNSTTVSVIADLPTPTTGNYTAWLKNGTGQVINLGNLKNEKGGLILDYTTTTDLSGYKNVVVSQETETAVTPGTAVLEGSF